MSYSSSIWNLSQPRFFSFFFCPKMQILFGVTKAIKAINMSTHFELIANDLFTCATWQRLKNKAFEMHTAAQNQKSYSNTQTRWAKCPCPRTRLDVQSPYAIGHMLRPPLTACHRWWCFRLLALLKGTVLTPKSIFFSILKNRVIPFPSLKN